eukprot:CAMPEP_0170170082 /NCGR_PEP_ID=MMETSP0040_2-20121228/3045_1 /TAXON_ID=641309 /ORGANISM="Lotharella oceanica, Strain CCMP622" /LENGTH=321 /DNA_ID=CAMNT_0010409241 /DNA_START=29 /DNA_END=994 /DNA_ORIENTATION=-
MSCLRWLCRRHIPYAARRSFLQKVSDRMIHSERITQKQGRILQALIKSEDKRLMCSASRFMNLRSTPEDDGVQSEVREKVMSHLEAAWHETFREMTTYQARQLAHKGRDRHESSQADLTYGEVKFSSLARILVEDLRRHNIELKGTFYDLGSGTGRGVIAAALVGSFSRLCGVELLSDLHSAAVDVQKVYEHVVAPRLGLDVEQEVKFVQGNFLKADWSDANVIFINSTCFSKPLMEKIVKQAVNLSPGTCVVTLTHPMVSPYFDLLESKKYDMSWGEATAHIHVRTAKAMPENEKKAQYWSKRIPGRGNYGAIFDGYTSA